MVMKQLKNMLLGLVLISFSVNAFSSSPVQKLNSKQKTVLKNAAEFSINNNAEDLKYIVAAIAWKESDAGVGLISKDSYGPFQNKLSTVINREKQMRNGHNKVYSKQKIKELLLTDFDFAAKHALLELEAWSKVHKGDLKKMLASYNAGYNYKIKRAQNYANDILKKAKTLKETDYVDI